MKKPASTQCNNIDGEFDTIAVTNMNAPDGQAYRAAWQAYWDAGSMPSYLPLPCPTNFDDICIPGMISGGACVVGP